jgi:hypothetical protein
MDAIQRLAALKAMDGDTAIRSVGLVRVMALGIWKQGELVAWLEANVSMIDRPRWHGDVEGDRGCYRVGAVIEALERDELPAWLTAPYTPFPPAVAAAVM